jgi:hypothetical protein
MKDTEGNTPTIFITGSVMTVENTGWLKFLTLAHNKSVQTITGLRHSQNFTTS